MIRFRPMLVPTSWFLPGLVLLAGLGFWQVQRLHEKEALIAGIEAGTEAPAVPLAEALAGGAVNAEWHHVRVTGHFEHNKEAYLFAQGMMGAVGVHIVTPLVQTNGQAILVDRGFVPEALHDPKTRSQGQIEGDLDLTGVLRLSQSPGPFTPAADTRTRLWFVKNVPEIAETLGIAVPPVIVEADATPNPGGWPLGGQTNVDIPNDHLQYAITWFGLALVLTAIYLLYHVRQGRLGLG
jgi:surfeit locus 1 family protein